MIIFFSRSFFFAIDYFCCRTAALALKLVPRFRSPPVVVTAVDAAILSSLRILTTDEHLVCLIPRLVVSDVDGHHVDHFLHEGCEAARGLCPLLVVGHSDELHAYGMHAGIETTTTTMTTATTTSNVRTVNNATKQTGLSTDETVNKRP